jgi:hypothetical protein
MPAAARPATATLGPVLGLLIALLSGCDEGRSPGVLVTSDGRMLDNNAANNRLVAADHIDQAVQAHCDSHWKSYTSIDPVPQWDEGRGGAEGDWMWPHAQVVVHLIGDGRSAAPLTVADIHDGVFEYMKPRVHHPSTDLEVQVEIAVDAARFARIGAPPPRGTPGTIPSATLTHDLNAPAAQPSGPAAQDYVIQAGDTWADLAVAFCGGAGHWRALAEANHWQGQPPRTGAYLVLPSPTGAAPTPSSAAPAAAPVSAPPAATPEASAPSTPPAVAPVPLAGH